MVAVGNNVTVLNHLSGFRSNLARFHISIIKREIGLDEGLVRDRLHGLGLKLRKAEL
jgi:hypothetical protein